MSKKEQAEEEREQSPETRRKRRRYILLGSLAVIFVALGAAYGVHWAIVGRYQASTDDAYVAGNQVAVMAQEKGTVIAVLANNTVRVHRGQTLVQLDDSNARIALQKAKAQLADKVRQINALHATEKQLQDQVAKQQATLNLARSDHSRDKKLHALGYYSTKKLEHSATLVTVDKRGLAAAKEALRSVRAQLKGDGVAGNPEVHLAAAQVRAAWLALKRTRIVAPISGRVAKRSVQVGEQVQPGLALMAVVPLNQVWVKANFKESSLGSIHIGQPAVMRADLYGSSVTFHGRVIGIGAGSGSAFSLLPPQNATGNWIKVVQRVPVRIGLSKSDLAKHALRIGLSMNVTVETGHGARGFTGPIVDPKTDRTTVYKTQADGANRLIAQIIHANTLGNGTTEVATTTRPKPASAGASHGQ